VREEQQSMDRDVAVTIAMREEVCGEDRSGLVCGHCPWLGWNPVQAL